MKTFARWVRNLRPQFARRGRSARPLIENLESRCLLSASIFYSIDGSGNNLAHPDWGSVGQDLLRIAPAQYGGNGSGSVLAGANRPSPRLISDVLATDATDGSLPNSRFMSDWVYAWGQFIDHDIDLTSGGVGAQAQAANIPVPTGDPFFDPNNTGTAVIDFNRSEFDPATGTSKRNPRQQFNNITAFLDGSMIYGSDPTRANDLRAHYGGRLLTLGDQTGDPSKNGLLPLNTFGLPNANDAHLVPDNQLFLAGDVRANENIELTAVHTLFLREHNRIADQISSTFPGLSDETVFQLTRAIVIAEVQSITFNEFLPALLGNDAIPAYQGYNPNVNPDIATEFSTAGYRVGHSLLAPDVQFLNPDGSTQAPAVSLANSFFNPPAFEQNGADPILKYLATDNAQEVDNKIVPELQNFLFGPPGAGGFDLASLNIQRGRDHGLADYNTTRAAYGLPRVTSFDQITSNTTLQGELKQLYGNVNNIDLWVGGLAEDHVPRASVGPLFQTIVADQFEHIRDGDRLWFENLYAGTPALAALENTTLAQVIARNTVDTDLQANVFFFKMQITGTVFNDANRNGVRDTGEGGISGRVIDLIDTTTNTVIAQTKTDANGRYSFNNLTSSLDPAIGYQVVEELPGRVVQTTPNPPTLTFSRGETFSHVDFGNASKTALTAASSSTSSSGGSSVVTDTGTDLGPLDGVSLFDVVRVLQSKR
jgi:hypothetical protein